MLYNKGMIARWAAGEYTYAFQNMNLYSPTLLTDIFQEDFTMSITNDILKSYVDGGGLVSNSVVQPGTQRASDNGVLFTSQFLILSKLNGEPLNYLSIMALKLCIDANDNLHRSRNDTSADVPDDYYGLLSYRFMIDTLGLDVKIPLTCLHPALLYLRYKIFFFLEPLVAAIVALSNINEAATDTSNKLLTWTLIHGASARSWWIRQAGKFWTWRMRKIYPGGTQDIARIYFGDAHPFVKWWIE